jgi:hypothetical protein
MNTVTVFNGKNNQKQYKHLAAIAKQCLAIQATSASAERMLSKANTLDEMRARLDPENVTRALFLMAQLDCFKDICEMLLTEHEQPEST